MACKHCKGAHEALLDLIVQVKMDLAEVQEAIMEHDDRLEAHDEDLDNLRAEDEVFESEDLEYGDE